MQELTKSRRFDECLSKKQINIVFIKTTLMNVCPKADSLCVYQNNFLFSFLPFLKTHSPCLNLFLLPCFHISMFVCFLSSSLPTSLPPIPLSFISTFVLSFLPSYLPSFHPSFPTYLSSFLPHFIPFLLLSFRFLFLFFFPSF